MRVIDIMRRAACSCACKVPSLLVKTYGALENVGISEISLENVGIFEGEYVGIRFQVPCTASNVGTSTQCGAS